jgi:hypothetical protein
LKILRRNYLGEKIFCFTSSSVDISKLMQSAVAKFSNCSKWNFPERFARNYVCSVLEGERGQSPRKEQEKGGKEKGGRGRQEREGMGGRGEGFKAGKRSQRGSERETEGEESKRGGGEEGGRHTCRIWSKAM